LVRRALIACRVSAAAGVVGLSGRSVSDTGALDIEALGLGVATA